MVGTCTFAKKKWHVVKRHQCQLSQPAVQTVSVILMTLSFKHAMPHLMRVKHTKLHLISLKLSLKNKRQLNSETLLHKTYFLKK